MTLARQHTSSVSRVAIGQFSRSLIALAILVGSGALAQDQHVNVGAFPSEQEIASRMEAQNLKRAADLKAYTSKRNYDLDYHGFPSDKHANMTVDIHLIAPHTKSLVIVSESGSGTLRSHVLQKLVASEREASEKENQSATALSLANYEFTVVGEEEKDGRHCYVVDVKPKRKDKFLYVGRVWIDSTEYAVVHISAQPAKNPSFWITRVQIEHQYGKFGEFWLPIRNTSVSSTRFGGQATLTIDYGQYSVEGRTAQPQIAKSEPPQNSEP